MIDFDNLDTDIDRVRFSIEDYRVRFNVAFYKAKEIGSTDEKELEKVEQWKNKLISEWHERTVELDRLMSLKTLKPVHTLDVTPYRKELKAILQRERFGAGRPKTEADLEQFAKDIDTRFSFHGWESRKDGEAYPEFKVFFPNQKDDLSLIRNINIMARIIKDDRDDYSYFVIERQKNQLSKKSKPCLKVSGEIMEEGQLVNFSMLESSVSRYKQMWTLHYAVNEAAVRPLP